jgi:excisionase family DNA binding protein
MNALNEALARDIARIVGPLVEDAVRKALPRQMEPERPGKNWLTNAEAMDYLGLSRPTLARYRKSGTLPYAKVGGNVFYRLSDVEALLEQHATGVPSQGRARRDRR